MVDNFERAMAAIPDEDKDRPFESGVANIYKQLMTSLESIGVKPMDCAGEQFDPTFHNAVMHVEDDNYEENVIVEEMQKGYMYKDQVLRFSKKDPRSGRFLNIVNFFSRRKRQWVRL